MDIENAQYDTSFAAEIEGTAGLFRGERTYCRLGQSVVVGRSRACDLSVARSDACLQLGREALDQHPSYRKISRRHIRITLLDADHLEVEDLSTNGTAVDGYRVDKRVLSDFRSRREGLRIEFGEGETLIVKPARGVPGPADELAANASGSHAGGLLD